jgi:preprotein translocase subunit SecG
MAWDNLNLAVQFVQETVRSPTLLFVALMVLNLSSWGSTELGSLSDAQPEKLIRVSVVTKRAMRVVFILSTFFIKIYNVLLYTLSDKENVNKIE